MKIAIIGYSGSGKSTLARKFGEHYDIPVLHLDTVQFLPNWIERDKDEGRIIVKEFMNNKSWVIDGNYSKFYQKERLEQADRIILLNFSRRICIYRAIKRYFKNKHKTRVDMAEGCIEKIDLEFIWWILYEGRTKEKREHYKNIENQYKDKIIVLKNPKKVYMYSQSISKEY
ncbi:MAG: DNA topology modulation protein [Peptostreptococcaceae bacterium]